MSWELHRARSEFAHYAADWDYLNAQLYGNSPFFDSRFIGPLLQHFGDGKELLCLHRDNDRVSGALIVNARGGGRWAVFRPSQSQVSAILLDDARLLVPLLETLPGWAWTLELHAIDPRFAPDFMSLPHIAHAHARTIGISATGGFDGYWKRRPKKLRENIRRYVKRAEDEQGTPQLTTISEPLAMYSGVTTFGELERAGWKGAAGTAVSIDNVQGKFYADVLYRFAQAGQAAIHELHIDGKLAASRLIINSESMTIFLKTAYDETLARFAPGRILLHHVIEHELAQHPERTIEFYTNATRDQSEWASFVCVMHNVQVFRNDTAAATFTTLRAIRRRLRSAAGRKSPNGEVTPTVSVFTRIDETLPPCDLSNFVGDNRFEDSLEWFELLRRTVYPEDPGVRYYCVHEDNRAMAILPVRLVTRGLVRSIEALSNFYTHLYKPLVTPGGDPLVFDALIAAATREQRGAHVMRFSPLDPHSHGYAALVCALRANGWVPLPFFCFGNWFHHAETSWNEYLKGRGRNLRSSIKRRTTRFAAAGGRIEIVDNPERIDEAIAAFQETYTASWKRPEPYPKFIPSLIRLLATRGMLRLGIARIGERAIAAQLWIVEQGKASIFKVAYHPDFAAYSPGTVLTAHLFRHAIETDHVREIDFLIGDDEYKRIWMSDRRERWGIVAYNPRTIIGLILLGKEISGRVVKVTKEKIVASAIRGKHRNARHGENMKAVMKRSHVSPDSHATLSMSWSIHPISRFAEHAEQWDVLSRSRPDTPFLESIFVQTSLEVFGTGKELLCLLHMDGCLRAGAVMQAGQLPGVWQTFQPSQLPLGAWVSDGKINLETAGIALMQCLPGWPVVPVVIGFSQLDPRMLQRPEDSRLLRTLDYIQTAWVDVEGSFESYWEARGKNLRQNTRKQLNRLSASGMETRLECITSATDVEAAIADYGRLESTGWKATDGTAIGADNEQGRFYRTMLERFCAQGRGRIYRYWLGDSVVAMDLCIHDESTIVILKTAYDETHKAISPSTLMRHDEFRQIFTERRFQRIEFFGKVMEWHTRWTEQSRTIYHATCFRWVWLKNLHMRRTAANANRVAPDEPLTATEH